MLKSPDFDLKPKILHFLKISQVSCKFLLSLVNDILDLAKMEHSEMRLSEDEFRVKDLFEELRQLFEIQCGEKQI